VKIGLTVKLKRLMTVDWVNGANLFAVVLPTPIAQ